MGNSNHSVSKVAKVLPPEVLGQIELDLTEGRKSQTQILEEYSARYPQEFAEIGDRTFFRWCQRILNDWESLRRELSRERLRATYALKNSEVAKATLQDCEEAAQRKFHELLAGLAADPEADVATLKQVVAIVDSIGVLGKLGIQRQRLEVLQDESRRRNELHELKMAEVKAAVSEAAKQTTDGKLDVETVANLMDQYMRGETI